MPANDRTRWAVAPGSFDLAAIDTRSTAGAPGDKPTTLATFPQLHADLSGLQDRMWAEHRRSLLVVLQGVDASGKDGTVKHVFGGVNPQGVRVASLQTADIGRARP